MGRRDKGRQEGGCGAGKSWAGRVRVGGLGLRDFGADVWGSRELSVFLRYSQTGAPATVELGSPLGPVGIHTVSMTGSQCHSVQSLLQLRFAGLCNVPEGS